MVGADSDGLVTLFAGRLALTLSPLVGGSIARFDHIDGDNCFAILRSSAQVPKHVLATASFPLVPFVNRIRGGTFDFGGRIIQIAPNMAGDPSPLHGQGWLNPWQVISASEDRASLRYEHQPGDWPWAYVAEQHFQLATGRLDVTLTCTNASPQPMPCGLGQHPYFDCTATTRIQTGVTHVWTIDDNVLPVEKIAATGRYDLSDRMVCGLGLDHGFGGWDGVAHLSDPAWPVRLSMSSPNAAYFQLYSPPSGGIFVAEPVTHANAALNAPEKQWAGLGLRILDPGESMALSMTITCTEA